MTDRPEFDSIGDSDDAVDLSPRTAQSQPTARSRRRKLLPLLLLGVALVAGGVIVTRFLTTAVDYYCNVDEIDVRRGCAGDRRLRVQGLVEEGSVVTNGAITNFTIAFNDVALPVTYDGEPGGIFKECLPVVVHGRIDDTGVFHGDRIEVKHSNEYVAVNDERIDQAEALENACERV